jgi:Phage Tail Collar Domain
MRYWCVKCGHWHRRDSKIGKAHAFFTSVRSLTPVGHVFPNPETGDLYIKVDAENSIKLDHGGTLSRDRYPDLYEAMGDLYGRAPEGEFRLPDLRGRLKK